VAQRRHRQGVVVVVSVVLVVAVVVAAVVVVAATPAGKCSGAGVVVCVHATSGAAAGPGGQPWCVTLCS
jgi:hypothetical protein